MQNCYFHHTGSSSTKCREERVRGLAEGSFREKGIGICVLPGPSTSEPEEMGKREMKIDEEISVDRFSTSEVKFVLTDS
jgi:hypothetical protein